MPAEIESPTFEDRAAMWAVMDFPENQWEHPAVDACVADMRARYGEVLFHSFRIPEHPVFDWYLSRNQLHECNFFERFWSAPGPSRFFPPADPALNYFRRTRDQQPVFDCSSSFHLAGDLASMLFSGGAYSRAEGHGLRSMRLGEVAARELLAADYEQTLCFISDIRWSDFFDGVAWDRTVVVVSRAGRCAHCLLATDTD